MTGGSQQLRRYRIARRDGATVHTACVEAGISISEARLIEAEDLKNPPPAEAFELLGHNSRSAAMTDNVSAEQLRLFIERIERLEEEKGDIADDIKDVYAEAKSTGFDVKTMRECVKLRKLEKFVRDEREALLDTYKAALGMDYAETPLGAAALRRTAEAINAGALGPGVTATYHPGRAQ